MSAKLTLVAALLAAALATTLALAQDQTPALSAAPPSTQADSHQTPVGPGTDMAQFCSRLREPVHYYPSHARDLQIQGSATLECALDSNNHPQTCWISSETPPQEEFGLAGLKIMCRFLNSPTPSAWTPFGVEGDARPHIHAPLNFRLNEGH